MSSHEEFMSIAQAMSSRSHDPSTKVGAIVVDSGSIIALGCNHIPSRIQFTEKQIENRDWKYPRVIHAEVDAILKMGRQIVKHPILYTTNHPCAGCAPLIVEAGIKEVYTWKLTPDYLSRWSDSVNLSSQILKEGGVFLNYLDGP